MPILLGQKKTELSDIPIFPVETIDKFFTDMKAMLASGQPIDMPLGVPGTQLIQLGKTLFAYKEAVENLLSEEEGAVEAAQVLLATTPEVKKPKSRLVLPT